jgi:hypothetical protein
MLAKRLFHPSRRFALNATMTVGLIAIIGLVIVSPFALVELAHSRLNWSQLSNIGQTYGAVSALLSSLALFGVVISLLYQARANRIAYEQTFRTFQLDLLKMELEDPSLMTATGAPWGFPIPSDFMSLRQFVYVQMWLSSFAGRYVIGELSDATARDIVANEVFRSSAGRSYWAATGQSQLKTSKGRLHRFCRLLDDEYKKALSSNIPIANPIKGRDPLTGPHAQPNTCRKEQVHRLGLIAAAAVVGTLAGRFLRRSNVSNPSSYD